MPMNKWNYTSTLPAHLYGVVLKLNAGTTLHFTLKVKSEEKTLGKPRSRWEGNIRRDLREIGWGMWTECMGFRIGTISSLS
jgi:hypothetical protein